MEGQGDIENYDATFIEQPAILDKHKAAAVIVDGKYPNTISRKIRT
jgi:hypothetical protein